MSHYFRIQTFEFSIYSVSSIKHEEMKMTNATNNTIGFQTQGEAKMSQVSMLKGYWFYFKHNGNDISVHGSSWSGKEVIYLNNHPVSIKRNFTKFVTTHDFEHDGVNYQVVVTLTSVMKGEVTTEVFADGKSIGMERLAVNSKQCGPWYKTTGFIAMFFVCGLAFGYLVAKAVNILFGA